MSVSSRPPNARTGVHTPAARGGTPDGGAAGVGSVRLLGDDPPVMRPPTPNRHPSRAAGAAIVLCALLAFASGRAHAGGGASRTAIVVNADSPTSLHIANEYAARRGIPAHHICRLHGIPHRQLTTVDLLRERVLAPLEAWLVENGLDDDIDTITYSTDFPFAANFASDGAAPDAVNRVPTHLSLTGATFLARRVLAKDVAYAGLQTNRYGFTGPGGPLASRGFRSTYLYDRGQVIRQPDAEELATSPDRYRLATMLAWHGIQGQTVPAILASLEQSVGADATMPTGTVYLMDHPDVRAQTRRPFFERTAAALAERGRKAVVLKAGEDGQDGVLPKDAADAIGIVAGIAGFDWSKSGSTMLPGAIAEHLTSFGGKLDGSGQTKLTAFLEAGAAGSSGTVAEPLSIWMKFPTPFLHVHYADGCSLAEAFYQSVVAPYQLLIVGDPLTRPYAALRTVAFAGSDAKSPWSGTVSVAIEVGEGSGPAPTRVEAYVDGRLVHAGALGEIPLDTTSLEDGGHELHVAAIVDDEVETRSEGRARFVVANGADRPTLVIPKKPTPLGDDVKLSGRAPSDVKEIALHHGTAVLAKAPVRSGRWKIDIPAHVLGRGVVPLYVRGMSTAGRGVRSPIEDVHVVAPEAPRAPKKPVRKPPAKSPPPVSGKAGWAATVVAANGTKDGLVVKDLAPSGAKRLAAQLGDAAKGEVKRVTLTGDVVVTTGGVYQWAIVGPGTVRIEVSGEVVFDGVLEGTIAGYAETYLTAGAHEVEVTLVPNGEPALSIRLGGEIVPRDLGGDLMRH